MDPPLRSSKTSNNQPTQRGTAAKDEGNLHPPGYGDNRVPYDHSHGILIGLGREQRKSRATSRADTTMHKGVHASQCDLPAT
jgi:hypothetical protein